MKVKELIERLSKLNPEAVVLVDASEYGQYAVDRLCDVTWRGVYSDIDISRLATPESTHIYLYAQDEP